MDVSSCLCDMIDIRAVVRAVCGHYLLAWSTQSATHLSFCCYSLYSLVLNLLVYLLLPFLLIEFPLPRLLRLELHNLLPVISCTLLSFRFKDRDKMMTGSLFVCLFTLRAFSSRRFTLI